MKNQKTQFRYLENKKLQISEYSATPSSDLREAWVVSDHIERYEQKSRSKIEPSIKDHTDCGGTSSLGQVAGLAMLATICGTGVYVSSDIISSLHPNASILSSTNNKNYVYFNDDRAFLIHELQQYAFLENGWDGDVNDQAPSADAINEAIAFVENLPPFVPLPEPMVSSDGEAGLYWNDGHVYLDVGFRGNGKCVFFGKCNGVPIKGSERIAPGKMFPTELASFMASSFPTNAV